MKNLLSLLFLCFSLSASPCFAAPEELAQRKEISAEAMNAFLAEDFAKLEQLSTVFRQDKSRTSSGLWKLTLFYAGIAASEKSSKERNEAFWSKLEAKAQAWIAAYPQSPSARIAYSMFLIGHGWHFRGGNYASAVPPEAWEPFYRYIGLARDNLERNKATASVDPRWYETMMTVARAQNWDRKRFDALLNEALDKEPYFYQTYFLALEYLLPKWHGGIKDIEQFANQAVARTVRTEGQGMYARIYWFASQTQFENELFDRSLIDWSKMKAGFEDVVARYPDAWNINNYARFACLAKDKTTTRELFVRIKENPVREAWSPIVLFSHCQQWALES